MHKWHTQFIQIIWSIALVLLVQQPLYGTHDFEGITADELVYPYILPPTHPLKNKLDKIFTKSRATQSRKSLVKAGFEDKNPEPRTQVYVLRHKSIPNTIFKLYTDDQLYYYRNEPEHVTWYLRARGAKVVADEIARQGWGAFFKAPKKWIYKLPSHPKPNSNHLAKHYILVEEEMDLLPKEIIKQKWKDGTITKHHLEMLFFLITQTGLRGGCKYDNIPICYDGKLAFIDTQNHWMWPLPFERLFAVLSPELAEHWEALIKAYLE